MEHVIVLSFNGEIGDLTSLRKYLNEKYIRLKIIYAIIKIINSYGLLLMLEQISVITLTSENLTNKL